MKNHFYIPFLFLFWIFQSCHKELKNDFQENESLENIELQNNSTVLDDINVKVKDGTLHFLDSTQVLNEIHKISRMTESEFKAFEKLIGFKSTSTKLEEAYAAFDQLKTKSDLNSWRAKYKNVAILKDSIVTPTIPISAYQRITNLEGEYYVEGALFKILNDKIITILDGEKSKVNQALSLNKSDINNGILISDIVHKKRTIENDMQIGLLADPAPCGGAQATAMRQDGKRKVFLDFYIIVTRGLWELAGEISVEAAGHKKTLFGWNKYKSKYRIEDVGFSIVNGKGVTISANNVAGGNSSNAYKYAMHFSLEDVSPITGYSSPEEFQWVKGRATSRGTSPYWAVVCCNSSCPTDYGHYPF